MIAPTHGLLALQEIDALQKAAGRLGFEVVRYDLNTIDDVESAFAAGIRDDVTRILHLRRAFAGRAYVPYHGFGRRIGKA